jgi:transcriptional antiterminator RfaH
MLAAVNSSEKVWGVFRTKPLKEQFLLNYLDRERVSVYCPMVSEKGRGGKSKPFFPGYIFAAIAPRFELSTISRTPNILCPLIFGGDLAVLEEEVIARFRALEGGRGVIELERPQRFKKGDVVRIQSGSFAGINAVVTEWLPEKERIRLLLDYFGREIRLEADEALLA